MSIASIAKSAQVGLAGKTAQTASLAQSSGSSALSNSTGAASATSTSSASVSTTSTDVTRLQNSAKTLQSEILALQGSHGSANQIAKLRNTLSDIQKRIQQLSKQQTGPAAQAAEKKGTEPSENAAGSSSSAKLSLNSNVGTVVDTQA